MIPVNQTLLSSMSWPLSSSQGKDKFQPKILEFSLMVCNTEVYILPKYVRIQLANKNN